jgi:hypothetical protein
MQEKTIKKDYRAIPAEQVLADLPVGRQSRIKVRAVVLIAEELASREQTRNARRSKKGRLGS